MAAVVASFGVDVWPEHKGHSRFFTNARPMKSPVADAAGVTEVQGDAPIDSSQLFASLVPFCLLLGAVVES